MILSEKELLNELFAIPINPKVVAVLDGKLKLYSSKVLISKYKTSLSKNKSTASSYKFLDGMVNKQILTPVYLTKGLMSYSFMKIFGNHQMKGINAFYDPSSNRIFILIENNTSFGFSSDEWIGRLTIHECMHMACSHGKSKFLSLYYNEFSHFYNVFFHILADKPVTNKTSKIISKEIDSYIKIFYGTEVQGKDLQTAVFKQGFQLIHTILTKFEVNKKLISHIQDGYKKLISLFVNYQYAGILQALKDPSCHYIMTSLQKTYPAISNNKVNTLAIQELIFPSEIAAVFSEIHVAANKIPKAMSMIKVK